MDQIQGTPWLLLLNIFLFVGLVTTNPLVGEPYYCSREGAQVQVSSALLGVNSCLMCYCKNHIVQCNPANCPPVDGCYRLQQRPSPECCQTCLGCIFGDKDLHHGQTWQDECNVHQCQAGVLTSSELQCHVPCSNPISPKQGECCPACKGCWLEGRLVPEGSSTSLRLDPCVKCSCSGKELRCTKRSCPVLSCPPSRAILAADGCCPVCNGSREIFVLPEGRCFLGKYLYRHNDNRTFDSCTTCICHKGYLNCQRQTCPPLKCPEQYRQTKKDHCCSTCVYPTHSQACLNEGIVREHGDTWYLDKCSKCTCTHGRVTCQVDHCEYLNKECPIGFRKEKPTEGCCPQCVEEPGVCVTYGDPHYKTFDDYFFNFQGECRYELAKDCRHRKFSIRVNNDARRSSYFSWTRSLSLKIVIGIHKFKISLGQRFRTKVNRRRVRLPFQEHGLFIIRKGYLITVETPIGVQLNWDGVSYVEVKVDPSWRNQTCGLCGNFNRNPGDDTKMKNGKYALSDEDMANSWRSGRARSCSHRLRRQRKKDENDTQQIRTQRLTCLNSPMEASMRCQALNSSIFDKCREKVSVDSFYKSCLLDMCECPSSRMCECDTIVAFVRECERAHFNVTGWRTATKCGGFECPYGSMYMECAPACRPTCKNITPNPDCHMRRCRPKCYCPPPTVLHRGSCILPDQCPSKRRRRNG